MREDIRYFQRRYFTWNHSLHSKLKKKKMISNTCLSIVLSKHNRFILFILAHKLLKKLSIDGKYFQNNEAMWKRREFALNLIYASVGVSVGLCVQGWDDSTNQRIFFFLHLLTYFIQANTEPQMVTFPTWSRVTGKKKVHYNSPSIKEIKFIIIRKSV